MVDIIEVKTGFVVVRASIQYGRKGAISGILVQGSGKQTLLEFPMPKDKPVVKKKKKAAKKKKADDNDSA